MSEPVFKIVETKTWDDARRSGIFKGSAVDLHDGFIHFSNRAQLRETAARHFAKQPGLVLVRFESAALGDALKWEPSRSGALFPHLYATLDPALSSAVTPLPLDAEGRHIFPADIP